MLEFPPWVVLVFRAESCNDVIGPHADLTYIRLSSRDAYLLDQMAGEQILMFKQDGTKYRTQHGSG